MRDRKYWESLLEPGITAVVGAGGKTTVVSRLGDAAVSQQRPVVVTTTTKMGSAQVAPWNPYNGLYFFYAMYIVLCDRFA